VVQRGKRACVLLSNHNADSHAMHLHGHSYQVNYVMMTSWWRHGGVIVASQWCRSGVVVTS
jgi:hypothetical protein